MKMWDIARGNQDWRGLASFVGTMNYADVEQMFHNFKVCEPHRDYLRFIWHRDNDVQKPLADYRMTVHVFGNGPSPAIDTYGFRSCRR